MKKSYKSIFLVLGLAVLLNACDGQGDSLINDRLEDNPLPIPAEVSSGTTDFSTYVSLGASFTAGYADGALYNLAQQNSFPAMMAAQFGTTIDGGLSFQQPDINSEKGFNTNIGQPADSPNPFGRFKLDVNIPGPSPTLGGDPIGAYSGSQVHNFGVPGIQVGQLVTPLTGGPADPANPAFNPFYQRFASAPGTSTILGDAVAVQPSFFSLFIGANDVLGYAVSGASNEAIFTEVADFQAAYGAVINTLMTSTSADGVVMDIPFFLGIPLFQAVTYNAIPADQATADFANSLFAGVNGAIQACAAFGITPEDIAQRQVTFIAGNNPILVIDEELADLGTCFDGLLGAGAIDAATRARIAPYEQSRQLVPGELVLLSAGAVLGTEADGDDTVQDTPIGFSIPLGFSLADGSLSGDQYYLSLAEQAAIETRRQTFNGVIAAIVSDPSISDRIALVQATPFANPADPTSCTTGTFCDVFGFTDGMPGITVEGINLAPDFSPNGIFSTDGLHLNPRGSAIFANEWLEAIEAKFGATLPSVNVTDLPSVVVCGTGDCLSEQ